jgi:SSS family solute:Na+ symporter
MVLDLNPFVAGLILAGLWAADVSTATALLLGSATLVVGDIVKRFFAPDLKERGERIASKIVVLSLALLTYLLATTVVSILKTLLLGLTLTTAYTLVTLMTLFAPSVCRKGSATWTLLATMAAFAVWVFIPADAWAYHPSHFFPHLIYFTWAVSLVIFFLVAIIDPRRISRE